MKHYDSIPSINESGELKGEIVWGFNKLDGQNICVTYRPKKNEFWPFGSRTRTIDENDEQFGFVVKAFNDSSYPETLSRIVKENSGKKGVFNGVDEITFFFELYGENSFAGKHQPGDDLYLYLIDVFLKKKGYMEPGTFYELFGNCAVLTPELIYTGPLDHTIISLIQMNDWTNPNSLYPTIKEGVVFKKSTLMKGQRRPSVKVKTKWWLDKLHATYPPDKWKELE